MARKGKIEIGASVTVGAKEDGSLSAIEKRIDKLSNEEIEIKIKDATKDLKELEKMEKKVSGNIAASIASRRKELTNLIDQYKQEQKLRADGLKQIDQEIKAAKELKKIEAKRVSAKEKKNNGPTKREKELADITNGLKGIKGVINTFDDDKVQKTEERVRKLTDALEEYQVKLDAMKRLRKGNERTMYDTAKSEIADLQRALSAIHAVKEQTPTIKPKIEKKEKEVEQEKPRKVATPKPTSDVNAKAIEATTAAIDKQAVSIKKLVGLIQRYNNLVMDITGSSDENIGNNELTANHTVKDMIKNLEGWLGAYKGGIDGLSDLRTSDNQNERKHWQSVTGKIPRLIKALDPYSDIEGFAADYLLPIDKFETETKAIEENTKIVKENIAAKLEQQAQNISSVQANDNLQKENSLLEQKITNLKTINALLAEEELGEEQIVDIINAYRSAMEVAQDSPMFQDADNLKSQIAQKFADEIGIQADAVHTVLKDVSLSGEQAIEYFEQLAEGVPLDDINKLEVSADSTGDSYASAAQDVSKLTDELKNANQEASKLVALHGLSLTNLKEAVVSGGFPAPSIAVTDPDVYSGGYGEATVVFKKSTIAPEVSPANKIYGVDAFTPTYPSFGYELNEDELIKASERTGIAIEELRLACDRAHENLTDAVGTVGFSSNVSEVLQDLYMKNRGFVIETRDVDDEVQNSFHSDEELFNNTVRDFIKREDITFDAIVNDDKVRNEYIAELRKYADDFNKANAEAIESFPQFAIKESSISQIIDILDLARTDSKVYEDEKLSFEHDQAVIRGVMKVMDVADYNTKKSAFISENRSDYRKFVQDLISNILVKPNVRGYKGQRFDNTPEGIAAAISSYGGKNALYNENAFLNSTMDIHEFIIAASKTYNNLEEVTSDMARLQKDATGTHTPLQSKYNPNAIAGVIASENNMHIRDVWSKLLKAVDGNHTAESIGKALRDSGLTVDDDRVSHIAELADEARTVPTRYFEGKPQRAVGLDEIEFVSLPSDFASTPEMKEMLTDLGIKVVEHISGDDESRANALKEGMQKFGETDFILKLTEDIKAAEVATESVAAAQEKLAEANKEVSSTADKATQQAKEHTDVLKEPKITLPNLTSAEHNTVFGDKKLDEFLASYNIFGNEANNIADMFTEAMKVSKAMLEFSGDDENVLPVLLDKFNGIVKQISDEITNIGKIGHDDAVNEDIIDKFLSFMKDAQIRYDKSDRAEFSSDWKNIRKEFKNILTMSPSARGADSYFKELIEKFPSIFGTEEVDTKQEALRKILNEYGKAKQLKKDGYKEWTNISDEDLPQVAFDVDNLLEAMTEKLSKGISQTEQLASAEEKVADAVERTNEAREKGLSSQVSAEQLIERDLTDALSTLRTAKDNETTLFTLKGVFEGEDLVQEARSFIDNIAEKANLSVGKFGVKDDTIHVQLYNDALKVTVDQTYRLRAATEEVDAALELVSQSFAQNVKALNTNNFDVEGMQARAVAAVNKVKSSLHGLEYDLTSLETAAKNITSKDDFDKFSNQLKAAQDNIQAMKNAVVSKSSLNQLANMQRDMKNANTELETMRRKLQRLGEIEGVKDAQKTIDDMVKSVAKFNDAADASAQQKAYNEYSGFRSQFNAQLGLLSVVSSVGSSGDLTTDKANRLEEFTRWEANIRNVGMLSDETADKIRGMGNALSQVQDNTGLQKWTDDFKKLQSTVAFETMGKQTKARMDEIKSSLNAQKQELQTLYKELDFEMQLDDSAPNADAVRTSYQGAIDMIERCTRSIGDQSQEEIAAATAAANAAKEKINAYKSVQDVFTEIKQQEETLTGDSAIKGYYQTLSSTIQQIANLDSKINSFKIKDGGSGTWLSLIASLEMQRDELLQKVRDTASQIGDAFNDSFIVGTKVDLPFSSILNSLGDPSVTSRIESFLSDVRTQGALTEQSIDKLIANLQNAQNKAEEFATSFAEKFSEVSKSAQTLEGLRRSGAISGEHELYKGGLDRLGIFQQYTSMLPQDITTWDAGQTVNFQRLASEVIDYVSALEKAASKEAQYFAGKKQYSDILNVQEYDAAAQNIEKMSQSTDNARQKLEAYAKSFRDGNVVITDFKTGADGISKINFSFFDDEIDQFRTFTSEMGQFTNKVYTFETSMKNLSSGTNAANKVLGTLGDALSRLKNVDGAQGFAQQIRDEIQKIEIALAEVGSSKDAGSQTKLKNLAADAQNVVKDFAKLEQQWARTQAAIDDGKLEKLGKIDLGSTDKYAQMLELINTQANGATISIKGFNDTTNTLTYTVTDASGVVKEMTANIDGLTGTVTTGAGKVGQLKTAWQEVGSSIGGVGKEILRYGVNMLQVMDIVRYLRQGFNEVKEIDTALTELRKVTNETDATYNNFLQTMSKTGAAVGSTVKDLTTSAADWARLNI